MTAAQDPTTACAHLAQTLKTAASRASTRACTPTTESVMMVGLGRPTAFARCTRIAPTAPAQRREPAGRQELPKAAATHATTLLMASAMMAGLGLPSAVARCTRIAPTVEHVTVQAAATLATTLLMAIAMMAGLGLPIPFARMGQIAPTVEHATVRSRRHLHSLSVSAASVTMPALPMRGPSNALPPHALIGETRWSRPSWEPAAATWHAMARALVRPRQRRTSQQASFKDSAHSRAAPALERARTKRKCFPP